MPCELPASFTQVGWLRTCGARHSLQPRRTHRNPPLPPSLRRAFKILLGRKSCTALGQEIKSFAAIVTASSDFYANVYAGIPIRLTVMPTAPWMGARVWIRHAIVRLVRVAVWTIQNCSIPHRTDRPTIGSNARRANLKPGTTKTTKAARIRVATELSPSRVNTAHCTY